MQHYYSIVDKDLKTLVYREAMKLGVPLTLRFMFEIAMD